VTLGAPPGRIAFPAINRPSAAFVARFERSLRALENDALGAPFSMTLGGCVEGDFASCVASLGPVSQFAVVAIGDRQGLIGIPDTVLDGMVEFACGGDNSEATNNERGVTTLGLAIGARMAGRLAAAVAPVFRGMTVQTEGSTDLPSDVVGLKAAALACGFAVEAGGHALGAIGLLVPMQALADIESGPGCIDDPVWSVRIKDVLAQTRTQVRAVLARPVLTAGEVARLVPGAVIPIPTMTEIALIAGGYRIASGVADARDGRAAIRINRTEFQS
jgi:flagellar motor switch protein FliM